MTPIIPNAGQEAVIRAGVDVIKHGTKQVFQFVGNPGTGKSFVLSEIIRRSGIDPKRVAPMAYTGTAVNVMKKKGLLNAKTIHSTLYEVVEETVLDGNGKPVMDTYLNKPMTKLKLIPKPTPDVDVFVIDEGSMVPFSMKAEIESRGIPIIVTGDLDQLPPVADTPAYLADGDVMELTEIMRQALDSPIIYLSQRAKHSLPIHCGIYGNYYDQSVLVIDREDLTDEMLINSQAVLCGTNRTREEINDKIRHIKGYSGRLPQFGEKIICRNNNRMEIAGDINLANGLMGYVLNRPDPSGINLRNGTYKLDFKSFISDVPFVDLDANLRYFNASPEEKKAIKNAKFGQSGELFELAYAITVHLSQGSQYDCGLFYEEFLRKDIHNKLVYTAISRFAKRMIYVKAPVKKYF